MDDEYISLLADLHKRQQRQGPGGEAETAIAMELADLDPSTPLRIADIGCGTGASTLQLAQTLNANVTAVDFLPDFIDVLIERARTTGLSDRINTLVCSMEELPFADDEYDVIWSEGAIYNMGFGKGVNAWRRFLKPGGILAVSEITWTTGTRPEELQTYWDTNYPEIATASEKIAVLEKGGYTPVGYFVLPEHCWLKNYYQPLQDSYAGFLERHQASELAASIVHADKKEIEFCEKYKSFYSYGFYVARRSED